MTPWTAACQASSDKWKNTEFHILVCITVSYCQNVVTKTFNSVEFVVVLLEADEMTGAGLHNLATWLSSSPDPWSLSCHFAAPAAAAKSLQSCPTLRDPIDGSPPCSSVPGLSRQEHWSGLLFPSPMHESEKWKGSHSVLSIYSWPHGLQPTRLLRPCDWPGKSNGVGCHHLHIYIWVFFH